MTDTDSIQIDLEVPELDVLLTVIFVMDYYLPPVIIIVGIVGNVLSFILMRQPQYRDSVMSLYMRCLAISDTAYLTFRVLQRMIQSIVLPKVNDSLLRRIWCIESIYTATACDFFSSYLLVLMAADRFVALMFPFKAATWCTKNRTTIKVTILFIITLLVHSVHFFRREEPRIKHLNCPFPLPGVYEQINLIALNAVISGYLPSAAILFLNISIVIVMVRSRQKRKDLQETKEGTKLENHITTMLLVVCLSYVIFQLPIRMNHVFWLLFKLKLTARLQLVAKLCQSTVLVITYLNFSLNFYFYVLICNKFRRDLRRLMCGPTISKSNM